MLVYFSVSASASQYPSPNPSFKALHFHLLSDCAEFIDVQGHTVYSYTYVYNEDADASVIDKKTIDISNGILPFQRPFLYRIFDSRTAISITEHDLFAPLYEHPLYNKKSWNTAQKEIFNRWNVVCFGKIKHCKLFTMSLSVIKYLENLTMYKGS